jgi:hypothetical protein
MGMPLRRADTGLVVAQTDAIYFPMQNVQTEERVVCKVAYPYLHSRIGMSEGGPTGGPMLARFKELRDSIEAIASRKYDAGENPPFVSIEDL